MRLMLAQPGDTLVYEDTTGCTHEGQVTQRDGDHGLTVQFDTTQRYLPFDPLQDEVERVEVRPHPSRTREQPVEDHPNLAEQCGLELPEGDR